MLTHQALTERVIGLAIYVHRELGPGLLESVYETCLAFELKQAGIPFRRQVSMPVMYRGVRLRCQVGLLFNFNALRLKDGLRRLVRTREAELA
jgi:PD-(D/E)XK nuclease superfamily